MERVGLCCYHSPYRIGVAEWDCLLAHLLLQRAETVREREVRELSSVCLSAASFIFVLSGTERTDTDADTVCTQTQTLSVSVSLLFGASLLSLSLPLSVSPYQVVEYSALVAEGEAKHPIEL